MPRAVGPIFVAAILLLIGGGVVAGLRMSDEGEPTAQGPETEAPGGVAVTATDSPFDDEGAVGSPTPTESPTDQPSPDASPSPTVTGDDAGEGEPEDGGTDGRDAGDDTGEPEPSETRSPSDDETVLAIDDMPDTGGGAATVGVAAILVGAAAAGMRRR